MEVSQHHALAALASVPIEEETGWAVFSRSRRSGEKMSFASVGNENMFRGGSVLSPVTNPIYCTMSIKIAMGTWYYSVTLFMQGIARDW